MKEGLGDLTNRLEGKGFIEPEIPLFIEEVLKILETGVYSTISNMNTELEALGWGIRPLDSTSLGMIASAIGQDSKSYSATPRASGRQHR